MLILLLGISLLFLILGLFSLTFNKHYPLVDRKGLFQRFKNFCYEHEYFGCATTAISASFVIILLIATIVVGADYSQSMVIDDKIALYQEENQKIETSIDVTVQQYKNYEQETFEKCKTDPTMVLVMYPELKSNELITKQIDVYINNNEKIKKLKGDKLACKVFGWWLFFKH